MRAKVYMFIASGLLALTFGCEKRDPLFCDEGTPCSDPERPFCDLEGDFPASDGVGKTCIANPFDAGAGDAGSGGEVADAGSDEAMCEVGAECDDGQFCNGLESCADDVCEAGAAPECGESDACTVRGCNEELDECSEAAIMFQVEYSVPGGPSGEESFVCDQTEMFHETMQSPSCTEPTGSNSKLSFHCSIGDGGELEAVVQCQGQYKESGSAVKSGCSSVVLAEGTFQCCFSP